MGTVSTNSSYRKKSAFSFSWHDFQIPKKNLGFWWQPRLLPLPQRGCFRETLCVATNAETKTAKPDAPHMTSVVVFTEENVEP